MPVASQPRTAPNGAGAPPAEIAILWLTAGLSCDGDTNRDDGRDPVEIADELHLSVKTVESYQAHIKEKLSLHSSRDLVQRAIEWKLGETAK